MEIKLLDNIEEEFDLLSKDYYQKSNSLFLEQIKNLFTSYPKLNEFRLRVDNHEFNDGEPTHFRVNTDEPSLNGYYENDFPKEFGNYLYDNNKNQLDDTLIEYLDMTYKEVKNIYQLIERIFSIFDSLIEDMYEDCYESITFKSNGDIGEE